MLWWKIIEEEAHHCPHCEHVREINFVEQQQTCEARHNAGKSHPVKLAHVMLTASAPPLQ